MSPTSPISIDLAFVPQFAIKLPDNQRSIFNTAIVVSGVVLLAALAQLTVPLPWTPVPITGQTFGVTLMALLWGRRRGAAVILTYLLSGAVGMPVFAAGKSGITFGPTFGYLVGMLFSTLWIGWLSDRGWTQTFLKTFAAALSGSVLVFACGVCGLAFFLPGEQLLIAGVLPFLPGDLVKSVAASTVAFQTQKRFKR